VRTALAYATHFSSLPSQWCFQKKSFGLKTGISVIVKDATPQKSILMQVSTTPYPSVGLSEEPESVQNF
jgi:hypothetical protein